MSKPIIQQPAPETRGEAEMKKLVHNIKVAPVVLLVRAPILSVLLLIVKAGEIAEFVGNWLGARLPGFER